LGKIASEPALHLDSFGNRPVRGPEQFPVRGARIRADEPIDQGRVRLAPAGDRLF
jgi:hypothetical protein